MDVVAAVAASCQGSCGECFSIIWAEDAAATEVEEAGAEVVSVAEAAVGEGLVALVEAAPAVADRSGAIRKRESRWLRKN